MPNSYLNRRVGYIYNTNKVSATITSSASSVDGLFLSTVTFSEPVTGFTTSDVTVTNGTAEYIVAVSTTVYTLMVMPDGVGDVQITITGGTVLPVNKPSNTLVVTINTAWQYLTKTATSNMYYDFREFAALNGIAPMSTTKALEDLSGNGLTLNPLSSVVNNTSGITNLRDLTSSFPSTLNTGATFLNTNFAILFGISSTDGQQATAWDICGNKDATNTGVIVTITTAGKLQIQYQGFTWLSTSAVFANGAVAQSHFDIRFDFTADTLTVTQDGSLVAGSFTVSDIASVNPASYACTRNILIGAFNNNGTGTSNPSSSSVYYFAITKLSSMPSESTFRSYLTNKKATFELISTLTDATYLKSPHDVLITSDFSTAYISGKGDPALTTVDGSFAIVNITNPASPSITGGYANGGDQKDGETVLIMSPTRVMHFVDDAALLFDVSNPASPSLIRTVANANGVVNGAVKIGNYVFGANKGGFIDVFDVTNLDTFTLVGSYNTNTVDGMIGPHDIDVSSDGLNIVICSKTVGSQFAIYQVFSSPGVFIPIASWTVRSIINSTSGPDLTSANRIRVIGNTANIYVLNATGKNITTIDISNLSSPSILDTFILSDGSAGACTYRGKLSIAADGVKVSLFDTYTNPSDIKMLGTYGNSTDFTVGTNSNFHDIEWFINGNSVYCLVTCQNNGIAIFKINRY